MILDAFLKALGQLGDPRFRAVLLKGVGLTIALLAGVYWLFMTVLGWFLRKASRLDDAEMVFRGCFEKYGQIEADFPDFAYGKSTSKRNCAARHLADAWERPEGQEGITAFLDKRPPSWRP